MGKQQVLFTNNVCDALSGLIGKMSPNKVAVLADENTDKHVLPLLAEVPAFSAGNVLVVEAGDLNKDINTLQKVWMGLEQSGATRQTVLVNIGGGMVTDLGGFAAATYKRGIRFINVPTTLLGAVDAAVGGKTGINYNGLKNEIGVFREAEAVIVSTCFFSTLPMAEIKSGYAEMLKHGLLKGESAYRRLLGFDFEQVDGGALLDMLEESVAVKREIVEEDPFEQGKRRLLNLGHTAGHAFESLAFRRGKPVPHGYAVAWGLVVEAVLSKLLRNLDSSIVYGLAKYVYSHYGAFTITCADYNALLDFMKHDKKSHAGECNFSLLRALGDAEAGCCVDEDTVKSALDIYRDLMHL